MPVDPTSIADPRFVLLAWAGGLGLVAGLVSLTRVVGVGFSWLAAGTAALVGLAGALSGGAWWARLALLGLVAGALLARQRVAAGVMFLAAGVGYLVEAALFGGWLPAVTAAIAVGGVTGEMMLGHWYLVDPRLPRWTLRALGIGGIAGLVADGVTLAATAGLPPGGFSIIFWVLLATSVVLMVAVLAALRYPAYSGVMAATGLSYLAVLTTLGAVFVGRALVAGLGPFAN